MEAQTLRCDFAHIGVTQRRLASEPSYLGHRWPSSHRAVRFH
ncbi:hypothetical protein BSU04_37285 [Caballeronia sordidicola]|uniref:Uncharacterized protein n=1 Tax=Caballeronia sordidicola TaxID=196367 RepID=A0A226WQ46_CABSO|nr:hypothetical protein BSU04_37285 [Caballeronia sordidicola]